MLLPIALVLVLVLAGVALMPKKTASPAPQPAPQSSIDQLRQSLFVEPAQPVAPQFSLREQQLSEEADAIASVYREKANEAYIAELKKKAAAMLGAKSSG